MIKIIKEGTKKTITCDGCGCYFSYDREDIITKQRCTVDGLNEYLEKKIKCPQCEDYIVLEATR